MKDASRARKRRVGVSLREWGAAALLSVGVITSATSARTHPPSCVAGCSHQYNASMRAESRLHVANVQACGTSQVCKTTEKSRHEQAARTIQAGREACQDQCPGGAR